MDCSRRPRATATASSFVTLRLEELSLGAGTIVELSGTISVKCVSLRKDGSWTSTLGAAGRRRRAP
jgi:hypothetical protein